MRAMHEDAAGLGMGEMRVLSVLSACSQRAQRALSVLSVCAYGCMSVRSLERMAVVGVVVCRRVVRA